MPRKRKITEPGTRKYGINSNYTQATLEECVEKVKSGELSAYSASKSYKIPINTIKNKIRNKHVEEVGRPTALTKQEEIIIKDHIMALSDNGLTVGLNDVTLIIQRYLNASNRKVKTFTNNRPGWEWGQLYLKRHPDLKTTFGHNISRSRAQVNEEKINEFFDNLQIELENVSPENIYNFDETGFHDDPKRQKLLFRRQNRNSEVIRNSTKSCYTSVFCANAAGEVIPPYFIFKAKNTWSDWLIGAPPGSRMTVTKSGWIDLESFDDWFSTHFLPIVSKKEGKKVLICDNLSSHISVNTLKLCKDNNIGFICLVPNSTHLLQPLDVGYFSPLKSNWRTVLFDWRQTARGKKAISLPKNCFTALVKKALELGAQQSAKNVLAGFKATGIYPLDRQEVLNRLPEYAKTPINAESARESLGESFRSYLAELRNTDLGIKNQRKFQMPISVGKSVSLEEVELYYKKKAEAQAKKSSDSTEPNKATKRGRPQGSKNKKKMKTLNKENTDQNIPTPSTSNQISLTQIDMSAHEEVQLASDEPLEATPEVTNDIMGDVAIEDLFGFDGNLQSGIENEKIAENTTKSHPTSFSDILPGTQVIFRNEGSLFTGKVVSMVYPFYIIVCMCKNVNGGWKWPDKRESVKIRCDNIISIVDMSKIRLKSCGIYHINDDLLYMEWGE